MYRLAAVVSMAFMAWCCASLPTSKDHPWPGESPAVAGRKSDAHVCPVEPTLALTAWHVAFKEHIIGAFLEPQYLMFVGKNGEPGTLVPVFHDARKDLAFVAAVGAEFPVTFEFSEKVPQDGDYVWVTGYDVAAGMKPNNVRMKVLSSNIAGQIHYEGSPLGGSSGSCVLNEDGKIVAINTSFFVIRSGVETQYVGTGWLVAGKWRKVPKTFQRWAEEKGEE